MNMTELNKIRGIMGLTQKQKEILFYVNEKHMKGVDNKKEYKIVEVSPTKKGEILVRFKNEKWLRYTEFGEWY